MEEGDALIECVGCRVIFLFGGGEKAYFTEKDLSDPKRCAPCRRVRREGRQRADPVSEEREEVGDCDM